MAQEEQAGSPLFDMLADLARDPASAEAFRNDPQSIMGRYNLTSQQRDALERAVKEGRLLGFFEEFGGEVIRTNISC